MKLRAYQARDVDRLRAALRSSRKVLYVAPTGSGKTVLFAHIARGAAAKGKRVLVLLHRIELVRQTVAKLAELGVTAGLLTADVTQGLDAGVVVAAVQTLDRRQHAALGRIDLTVVDEAHHAVAPTWQRVLARFEDAHVLGVTATPARLDGRGLGDVFDALVLGPEVGELMEQGFLARARSFARPGAGKDLKAIRTHAGDYDRKALAALMLRLPVTDAAVADYKARGAGRAAFVFAVNRAHVEVVAKAFATAGVPAAALDGTASPRERETVLAKFRDGELKVLVSCELLTEGFDAPEAGVAILLRPTRSLALHRQMIGRVLRPKADGGAALLLDYSDNLLTHGLPDLAVKWSLEGRVGAKKKGRRAGECKVCPSCEAVVARATRRCPECGRVFWQPSSKSVIGAQPGELVELDRRRLDRLRRMHCHGVERAPHTFEDLKAFATARGYRPGWLYHAARDLGIEIPKGERTAPTREPPTRATKVGRVRRRASSRGRTSPRAS